MIAPLARGWAALELGDVVTLKRGYDLPSHARQHGTVPIVSSSGITGYHTEAKRNAPGVVAGRTGTLGEVFYLRQPYWPLNTTLYVQDFHGNDPRFIAYFLEYQNLGSWESAAAVPGVNRNVLHTIPVLRPPVPTQRKIAAILSAYDELIENNARRIKVLEEMAQRIYREWFVEFRFPGHEGVPLVDSELESIPDGWEVKSASEVIEIDPKTVVPQGVEAPFVPMTSISETTMHIAPIQRRISASGSKFTRGDTLLARITPCLENGKTAYVNFLQAGQSAVGSTEFVVLRPNRTPAEFVYLLARSESFRAHAIKSMSGATGRQRVRRQAFDSYSLALPPADLLGRFAKMVSPMFDLSRLLFTASGNLRLERDLLLPRLISGEVDVEDLNIDTSGLAA